ncbi:hypothetical protein WDW86_13110 [Bdellovibrionota bacterium FG-2]
MAKGLVVKLNFIVLAAVLVGGGFAYIGANSFSVPSTVKSITEYKRQMFLDLLNEHGVLDTPIYELKKTMLIDRTKKCDKARYLFDFYQLEFNYCSSGGVGGTYDCGPFLPRLSIFFASLFGDKEASRARRTMELLLDALESVSVGQKDEAVDSLERIKKLCG